MEVVTKVNRNRKPYTKMRPVSAIITLMLVLIFSCSFVFAADSTGSGEKISSIKTDDLNGKTIGIQTGSIFDKYIAEAIPGAKVAYFSTFTDELNALKARKVDGICSTETTMHELMKQHDDIALTEEPLGELGTCFLFPKNDKGKVLVDQMDEFLTGLDESGELARIHDVWTGNDDSLKVVDDYKSLPADNGTITFVTEGTFPPYDYYADNKLVGYEVDLAIRFCKEYGYGLELVDMNFDALMPAIQSGKCDFGASGIAATDERREKAYFSVPDYYERIRVAVLDDSVAGASFIDSVKSSFNKTFIQEDRYKLFGKGIMTTIMITVCSVILGTLLGFLVYLWCRKGGPVANKVTSFCVWLVQGLPVIVLLMLLYYVILGKVSISGMWVSVIGFTLVFAAAVYGMILAGVRAVDEGQTEASYALGFTDRQTFFGIVLPQAARHFMPMYKAEIVSLIKATAVVGYIAVQDLTKMGDIVRSRTYEAFFPLIAVAIIYFLLAAVLKFIVDRLTISVDPEKRSEAQILKGVNTYE
ncbi:MAG: transporter substrate-binding domain-containing protein [Clostridiales bacterium]|nr:transporter substrate-binding domain-containing protein [Clostridiales bacterium]